MATTTTLFDLKKLKHARTARFGDPEPMDTEPWVPAFTIDGMSFFYDDFQALHDLTLTLPTKRVTGLIGPSGCGKSTFLRTLNRMYETVPKAYMTGTVRFGEVSISDFSPTILRRRVGMVFQKPSPFPKSIFDNIAYGLRVNNLCRKRDLEDKVVECLQRAVLWEEVKDKLHEPAFSLSGGQQQRLCIARALAVDPDVLLLDEPCSALDPIATAKIEDLIFDLRRSCTIIIVTHNMLQAARISDYVGFFLQGELIEFDAAKKMFQFPSNKLTEDYITGRFG
ncbi:MAG TPA: phosphate ABC transporter ATP-binding protein PstB [Acidobacteriaceae bacterium]|nr:phosphate ABC transporter ATP-binding protein PstB [Acidobacteriaceae bacterium]